MDIALNKTHKTVNVGLDGINVSLERRRVLRPKIVDELAGSIKANGLLQPIVLRPRGTEGYWLVAGHHRLEAARKLKWEAIAAIIFDGMDADEAELAEIDENLIRAELSPIERALHVARRNELYEIRHPETKKGATGKYRQKSKIRTSEKSAAAFIDDTAEKTGKARSTIALDVQRGNLGGIGDAIGTSLDKGDEVDALGKLPADRRTALIERARAGEKVSAKTEAKKAKREQREQDLAGKTLALPSKLYGAIIVDPEWKDVVWSEETGMDRAAANHYPVSPEDVIKSRPVGNIAAKDCVLFLWTTNQHLRIALDVMETWGFEYKSNYVWVKDGISTGRWNRSRHEILLIGTRGNPVCPAPGTQRDSAIMSPRRAHSEKPECFLEMIEAYFPNTPKIELNCRGKPRPGWDAWGNEVEEAAE